MLDPFESDGCNAHLVGMILDAAVGAIIPDLVAGDSTEQEGDSSTAEEVPSPTLEVNEPTNDPG